MSIEKYHISGNWEEYEKFRLKKETGLQTGFKEVDKKIRALPGITTLVGNTGLGKSYFTMNVYLHMLRAGIPVILVDKEIGFVDTKTRLLCALSGLTPGAITSGKFQGNEEQLYEEAVEELQTFPLYYFDQIKQEEVEAYICEAGKIHQKRVFLVVDSLNRLILDFANRRGDIDSWTTLFNDLKMKYDNYLNIWLICEKNNEGGIKESNTTEYISELWLDMYAAKDGKSLILNCKKQRNGPKGVVATLTNKLPFCYQMETMEYLED